jgi:hypothetical protein
MFEAETEGEALRASDRSAMASSRFIQFTWLRSQTTKSNGWSVRARKAATSALLNRQSPSG